MERMSLTGVYTARYYENGAKLWTRKFPNLVATLGKDFALDTVLAGSAYSITGPFMGLITSASFTSVNAADTMTSHAGWEEGGGTNGPAYTGNRATIAFNAASGGTKASSSSASFTFSAGGVIKGAFLVLGTGAVDTKDDTNGTLYSAGLFSGGDATVVSAGVLTVDYTAGA